MAARLAQQFELHENGHRIHVILVCGKDCGMGCFRCPPRASVADRWSSHTPEHDVALEGA